MNNSQKMYLIQELQQFHKNLFALGIAISLSEIRDMIDNEHEINNFSSKINPQLAYSFF